VKNMRTEQIWRDFQKIRRVWPSAELSNSFRYLLIRDFPLCSRFNYPSTPLLIKMNLDYDYIPPEAYVDRKLRIWDSGGWRKSRHLDESLTPEEFLEKGWVKLCIILTWVPSYSLIDFIVMVADYLDQLEE